MNLPQIHPLILRSIAKRCVSKDEATEGRGASWFETREDALLTMRDKRTSV
jgi:hypothetical protein